MRKVVLGLLLGVISLAVLGTVVVAIAKAQERGKANAPDLEKIEFIHRKKGFARPDQAKAPKPPSCYKFLTPGKNPIRWQVLPVNYEINPTNRQGLDAGFITSAVFNSAETWDTATSKELMNDVYTLDDSATYGVQDYKNAITFGDYPTAGVIAVTTVWYNPATKAIVEFDVMFDTDWNWGNATVDSSKMDLQNIATHELGHGVGLNDVYDSVCSSVTMYGYSDYGEIQKRTLEQPDITGLQTLYP
ncbi:MAG: matrixin family metalloprotease [Patescibacteria group bacterium]